MEESVKNHIKQIQVLERKNVEKASLALIILAPLKLDIIGGWQITFRAGFVFYPFC